MNGWKQMLVTSMENLIDSAEEGFERMVYLGSFEWINPEWFQWRNHYLPLGIVVVVFWPVFATLFMAMAAASTWLFWLITSLIFGVIQLIYVSYQFFMISLDVSTLSILKTYSMLRSQILYYLGKSGLKERKSRRRVWRARLNEAGSYENFLKIPIEDKYPNEVREAAKQKKSRRASFLDVKEALLNRTNSFSIESSSSLSSPSPMVRSRSFTPQLPSPADSDLEDGLLVEELGTTAEILTTTTSRLREARLEATQSGSHSEAAGSLKHLLSGVVKRNHLTLEEMLTENARSVAESGKQGLSQESRRVIQKYYEQVEKCLDWLADSPLDVPESLSPSSSQAGGGVFFDPNSSLREANARRTELLDRITLMRKMKQNMGRTALMLSGGGAQAMYHLGTIRALIESNLYDGIRVISGTSGGSITAAMCAMKSGDELYEHVCLSTVSTDFGLNGEMKAKNIRWFPTALEMGAYWLKHKLLVDSSDFKRCCDFYFGDMTFDEAFEKTGKHVCITVTASRASGGTAQRLLLNHISTPHVTLSSAVAASCALPGVMAPAKLLTKDSTGKQEPFEIDGVEWIDGSVQADLPFQRISTLFNVSNYVVAQTNFHVVPLLNKAHHPSRRSFFWRWFQTIEWDIRNRALKLSKLGLFPRIFGQDISKVFKQKYYGNLTLVPRFTAMQTFGLKALANPTVKDMEGYLKYGQIAAWPYLNAISDMIRLEQALDACLARIKERCTLLNPDTDWMNQENDLESIASSSNPVVNLHRVSFFGGSNREAERLKKKVMDLERENFSLKQDLEEFKRIIEQHGIEVKENDPNNKNGQGKTTVLSEREVWNLFRSNRQ